MRARWTTCPHPVAGPCGRLASCPGHHATWRRTAAAVAVSSRAVDVTTVAVLAERRTSAPSWREVLVAVAPPWLAARAAVVAAYVLARVAVDQLGVARPAPLVDGLMAWDAHHYRAIAEQGYDAFPTPTGSSRCSPCSSGGSRP